MTLGGTVRLWPEASLGQAYWSSLYWALTTLTTVGYGDITPTNNLERIYTLFALLLGALVFGFILSAIGSLVQAVDRQAALSEERLVAASEFLGQYGLFPQR